MITMFKPVIVSLAYRFRPCWTFLANAYPDKPAINYYGSEITFWELREMAIRLANVFSELGIKKGDRVGLHLPNIPQYLISYYATLYVGAIVVNFNPLYTPEELTALVKQTGVSTFITFDMVIPNVKAVTAEVAIPRVIATSVFDFMDGVDISTPETLQMDEPLASFFPAAGQRSKS